jgi:spoIIIJ-associated protein
MENSTPLPAPAPSTLAGIAPRDVLQKILDTLGIPAKVEEQTGNGSVRLFVSTPDPARLIGRRGQTIYQLQFLLNRMLQRAYPELPRVVVDCQRPEKKTPPPPPPPAPVRKFDELLKKADETAEKVRRWGDPLVVGPFDSPERQAIKEHFASDAELEVLSEPGEEDGRKRIMIRVRKSR